MSGNYCFPQGLILDLAHDNRERVSTITYPGGNVVRYTYNARSRPTSVVATIGGANMNVATITDYVGYNLGPRKSTTFGNGAVETRNYNLSLRLTGISTPSLQSHSYTYNANSLLTGLTNSLVTANNQTFGYDPLSRLTSVTSSGLGNQTWTLDANGNRESHVWGGLTDDYVPDAYSNQLPLVVGTRAKAFSHDPRGNVISRTGFGGDQNYAYDDVGRLSALVTQSGSTAYTYNALNQRVRKTVAGPSRAPTAASSGPLTARSMLLMCALQPSGHLHQPRRTCGPWVQIWT